MRVVRRRMFTVRSPDREHSGPGIPAPDREHQMSKYPFKLILMVWGILCKVENDRDGQGIGIKGDKKGGINPSRDKKG